MQCSLGYGGFRWTWPAVSPRLPEAYLDASTPYFSVGEYWDTLAKIQAWISGSSGASAAFDFPFKYTLNACVASENYSNMRTAGLLTAWWASIGPCVTFIEDHDTAPNGTVSTDAFRQ